MNFFLKPLTRFRNFILISIISTIILSCGSGAIISSGISGTGIVFGTITGFGSIFVNGIEYEIDDASFDVDGDLTANQDQLKIGMVVTLNTTEFDDGTFEANNVVYDDAIEGPITSDPVVPASGDTDLKLFTVLGVDVVINSATTTFDNSSFETLKLNDIVEVSGFVDANGQILATLIEKKGELVPGDPSMNIVEMHGIITALTENISFSMNDLIIFYDGDTPLDDLDNGLMVGLTVEVKGFYDVIQGSITALEIEGEDDDLDRIVSSGTLLSLQGLIAGFTNVAGIITFTINGIIVEIDTSTSMVPQIILDQLVEGLQVEVAGIVENGILIADRVEIREGKSKYEAEVKSLDLSAQTLRIGFPLINGDILLKLDTQSKLEDEDSNSISLSDLSSGDEVKIEARIIDDDRFIVSLKRKNGELDSYEISGIVEAFVDEASITIDGLVLPLDPSEVVYDPIILPTLIVVGSTIVELEDNDQDGDFEVVELKL